MSADAERYGVVAQGFTERLEQVGPDQWSRPTPCADWTVRDLVAHVVSTQRRVLAALEGGEAAEVDVDGDLLAQWSAASGALLSAVSDPQRAATTVNSGMGEFVFGTLVGGLACSDTVIHTWDLARATGQAEGLDAGAVEHCAEMLARIGDGMRRPGGFGPALECAVDADAQTKFLLFAGRTV